VSNGSTPPRANPAFWDGSISWVSSGEVQNNHIAKTRERITQSGFQQSSLKLLSKGTVLLAMIGEGKTRGQTAILDIKATINQNIAAVDLSHGLVVPEFLWLWFQLQYQQTRERGAGNGPKALNSQAVRDLPFVLAPLLEQREIVRRVKKALAYSDKLSAEVQQAVELVVRLDRAVLEKAFRGELVPQNPNDESASSLLERIRPKPTTGQVKRASAVLKRKTSMPKLTPESVKEAITNLPGKSFSFEDLRSVIRADYDELKQIIFQMLAEPTPGITQRFDLTAKAMRFERSRR
jgi:type I restriction enzyme S subunit